MDKNYIRTVASAVIPYEGKFVYVKTKKDGLWGLPAGKLNPFEEIQSGLVREVKEETNLQVIAKNFLGVWDFKSSRGNPISNRVFYTRVRRGEIKINRPEEILEIRTFSLKELNGLYLEDKMRAGKSNLEPVEAFIRGERYPLSIIHTLY